MKAKCIHLYDEVEFKYHNKICYGQIINTLPYESKIICHVDQNFYPIWVRNKDIHKNGGKHKKT